MDNLQLQTTLSSLENSQFAVYDLKNFDSKPWMLTSAKVKLVLDKLQKQPYTLGETFKSIFQGIVTGIDEIYFLERISDNDTSEILKVFSQREQKHIKIEKSVVKPILKGEDVSRYSEPNFNYYCIYPYKLVNNKTVILEEDELSNNFPLAYQYLKQYKKELTELRKRFRTNSKYWYSCHRGRKIDLFESARIISPEISAKCNMTVSPNDIYHNTQVYSFLPPKSSHNELYWLGLLNSKVMWWFLSHTGTVLRGGYFRFKTKYLNPFPIRTINFDDPEDVSRHDLIVTFVEQMLQLHKDKKSSRMPQDKEVIQRQIDATNKQIDKLVYELYGLIEDEIKIIDK